MFTTLPDVIGSECASTPLTEAQFSLLAHRPNFAIAPRHPPMGTTLLRLSKPV